VKRVILQAGFILATVAVVGTPSARVRAPAAPVLSAKLQLPSLTPPPPLPPRTDAVILVALDGARWQEVFVATDPKFARAADRDLPAKAVMPNLHRMMAEGGGLGGPECGGTILASGPNFVSLPGYLEIFTGRPAAGCTDNECPATRLPTLVDEVRARSSDVAAFASWAPIARAEALRPSDFFSSTGEPETGEFRPDRVTADLALAYLSAHRPKLLFIGLGEPDEYAHRGDYAGYLGSLRSADDVLGQIRSRLAQMGERGRRTSVFVTCDHGRSDNFQDHGAQWPESSRAWLVASGGAIPSRGAVACGQTRHLADIAPTVRVLMRLPADPSPEAGKPISELLPSP
jgi:hypothetical protein